MLQRTNGSENPGLVPLKTQFYTWIIGTITTVTKLVQSEVHRTVLGLSCPWCHN